MSLVIISSDDRTTGTNSNSFSVKLKNPVYNVTAVELEDAFVPYTLYNIRTGINTSIYFDDGAPKAFNIAVGGYTIAGLLSALETAFNSASTNFTCTYSTTTRKITIARSAGTFSLLCTSTSTAMWSVLGYSTSADTSDAASHVADNIFDLAKPRYILLKIDEFGDDVQTTGGGIGTFYLPIEDNFGEITHYAPEKKQMVVLSRPTSIFQLKISSYYSDQSLVDYNGVSLDLILKLK